MVRSGHIHRRVCRNKQTNRHPKKVSVVVHCGHNHRKGSVKTNIRRESVYWCVLVLSIERCIVKDLIIYLLSLGFRETEVDLVCGRTHWAPSRS